MTYVKSRIKFNKFNTFNNVTSSTVTKTIERAFGEGASVLDLCTMTEKEKYGYSPHAMT